MLQVIAAIGVGLLSIAALAKVKPLTIGIIALLIIFLHNMLQYVPPASHPFLNVLMNVFFRPGLQQVSPEFIFFYRLSNNTLARHHVAGFFVGENI